MTPDPLLRRVRRRRALARLTLWFERLWPALWPAIGLAGLFVCLALFDLPRFLPPWPHAAVLAGFALGCLVLLWRGLRRFRPPGAGAADRRLERASGLAHQPLATLIDRPALLDGGNEALWRAHVARAATALRRLRVGAPHPGLAAQDPRALRLGLVVLLVAGAVAAGGDAPARLGRAFAPDLPEGAAPPAPLLQAWITLPAFTGLAPVFLHPEGGSVTVPAGSHLTVSLTGGRGEPSLLLDGRGGAFKALDADSWQAERELTAGARVTIRRRGRAVASWDVSTIADTAPVVAFTEPPGPAPRGLQTRLPWKAEHRYGVAALDAELRLKERPDAPVLSVPIPLPGSNPKSAHGIAQRDLTANPWAGLPVTGRLVGRDGAGLQGVSDTAEFTLPERHFEHPVARALIAIRRMLTLHPLERSAAIRALGALMTDPDAFDGDPGVALNLAATAALLGDNPEDGAVDEAQERMWQLALHLEEHSVARTARALAEARQAAREALDRAQTQAGKPIPPELDRRMRELERAIERHLQALAEQARRDGADSRYDPSAQHLTDRDLQRMVEQMRDDARQGRTAQAQQEMAQLEKLLDQLQQSARAGRQGEQQRNAQRQRGRQQMGALQDLAQREGRLLDRTQGRTGQDTKDAEDSPQVQPGGELWQQLEHPGRRPSAQPAPPQDSPDAKAARARDARTQRALRRALGELMQQTGDLTGKIPDSLGQADTAMRESGEALAQGQDGQAAGAEQRAIEALQKGGREMGQQMARQFGVTQGQGAGQDGQDQDGQDQAGDGSEGDNQTADGDPNGQRGQNGRERRGGRRDPLGRLTREGTSGADEGSDVQVPEQMERARSRAIQDELRRRGAERDRPAEELDYIDRLLKSY